jgi:hypothetical protein
MVCSPSFLCFPPPADIEDIITGFHGVSIVGERFHSFKLKHIDTFPGTAEERKGSSMPGAEGPGESTPFTAVLADIDYGIRKAAVIDFHVSPLFEKKVHNFFRCSRVNFMA